MIALLRDVVDAIAGGHVLPCFTPYRTAAQRLAPNLQRGQRLAAALDQALSEQPPIALRAGRLRFAEPAELPPGEPFILPAGKVLLINDIRDTKLAPFTGEAATNYAMGIVRNQKLQEAVAKGVDNLVKVNASKIKYNASFKPARPLGAPPPAPAAKPPAPTPPALKP